MDCSIEDIFRGISGGREEVYDFCCAFFEFFHLLDDLIDQDKPVETPTLIVSFVRFINTIAFNPFFQTHKAQLMPVIHTSAMAFIASERLRKNENIQLQVSSEVLKSQYQDIFFFVAFLVGGSAFALECDVKYRSYCFG